MPNSQTASSPLKWAALAVMLYTGWNARSIVDAWQHSPFDHWDLLAWLIWMAPVVLSLRQTFEARLPWLGAALVLTFGGALLDLNLLKYLAFALACAGLTAPRLGFWLWLPMALSWMPALGWLFSKYDLGLVAVGSLRVVFAATGTLGYAATKR